MKTLVYTALLGQGKDRLHPAPAPSSDIDYVCLVDTDFKFWKYGSPGWVLRKIQNLPESTPRRTARHYKTCIHRYAYDFLRSSYDYFIWIDGCLSPRSAFVDFVTGLTSADDLLAFKHPKRACIYAERVACTGWRKDNVLIMKAQVAAYKLEGYPEHNGLAETSCVVRRNTAAMNALGEAWWDEIGKNSHRDQLSFDYVCWKRKIKYGILPGCRDRSPLFDTYPHWTQKR